MNKPEKIKKFKLILGLGNKDLKSIEKVLSIYNTIGIDVVDIAPDKEVFELTKRILNKQTEICVSVSVEDDRHSIKAEFDKTKCTNCKKCLQICQENAFSLECGVIFYNEQKCVGCQRCECEAIKFINKQNDLDSAINLNPDEIELHISTKNKTEIFERFEYLVKNFKGNLSVCLSREHFSDSEFLKTVDDLIKIADRKISIQADGKAISGGLDNYNSTLQTVTTADLLKGYDVNIILSGGTNSKTAKLADLCEVHYDMIAIGSYARKIVTKAQTTDEAIENAKSLVESVKNSD